MSSMFKSPSYSAPEPVAVEPAAQRVEAPTSDNGITQAADKKKSAMALLRL